MTGPAIRIRSQVALVITLDGVIERRFWILTLTFPCDMVCRWPFLTHREALMQGEMLLARHASECTRKVES